MWTPYMWTHDLMTMWLNVEFSAAGARMDALEADARARKAEVRILRPDVESTERDAAMEARIALAKARRFR